MTNEVMEKLGNKIKFWEELKCLIIIQSKSTTTFILTVRIWEKRREYIWEKL